MIRLLTEEDIPDVLELVELAMSESIYYKNLDFDINATRTALYYSLLSDFHIVCISVDESGVHGIFSVYLNSLYTVQIIAYEELFYVHPDYRRGKVAIKLCEFVVNACKVSGAAKLFSTATLGLDTTGHHANVFSKLLKRFGFEEINGGCVLVKELSDG